MAAIQLPATRTAMRAQRTRTEAACPAKSDTATKSATPTPARGFDPTMTSLRSSEPFRRPWSKPSRIARPATEASGSGRSAARRSAERDGEDGLRQRQRDGWDEQ